MAVKEGVDHVGNLDIVGEQRVEFAPHYAGESFLEARYKSFPSTVGKVAIDVWVDALEGRHLDGDLVFSGEMWHHTPWSLGKARLEDGTRCGSAGEFHAVCVRVPVFATEPLIEVVRQCDVDG